MERLQAVEWQECFVEPRRDPQLEREMRKAIGFSSPATRYFSSSPWIVRSMIGFHRAGLRAVYSSTQLVELIHLVISQDNSCRFCYAAARTAMRLLGVPDERVEQLQYDLAAADLSGPDKAALEFCRRVSRADPLAGSDDWRVLRAAGLEDGAVKEVAFTAAISVYFNRLMTLPAVPVERIERISTSWLFRLMLPIAGLITRSRMRRGQLEQAIPGRGPYAYLVSALGRLPAARALQAVIEDVWGETVLPRRTKALVFAVVARGLGCPVAEDEARRLLADEDLGSEDVSEILGRLASPRLDSIEAVVVPFARETIRYDPAQIQRRGRDLFEQLGNERFVDLVGVAAFANAVCRMSVIIDPPDA